MEQTESAAPVGAETQLVEAPPAPDPAEQQRQTPADLNPAGVRAAVEGVELTIDGATVLLTDALPLRRCRPGRPETGCQGRGFRLKPSEGAEGKTTFEVCGCVIVGWRQAHPAPRVVLLTEDAAAEEARREDEVRARLGRKQAAASKAEDELAALLTTIGGEVGASAQELATAEAQANGARARAGQAAEMAQALDEQIDRVEAAARQEIADIEAKLKARVASLVARRDIARSVETMATEDATTATVSADSLRARVDGIRERHGSDERALRRRIEKLGKRAARIIERHPEAALT